LAKGSRSLHNPTRRCLIGREQKVNATIKPVHGHTHRDMQREQFIGWQVVRPKLVRNQA
jgi:hypothetical protein